MCKALSIINIIRNIGTLSVQELFFQLMAWGRTNVVPRSPSASDRVRSGYEIRVELGVSPVGMVYFMG